MPAGLVGEQTRSGGTHASARTPVSAHWFPVRGPTRILAPRTEIGCACRRGGGRGCVLWRGGLAKHMLVCLCSPMLCFKGCYPNSKHWSRLVLHVLWCIAASGTSFLAFLSDSPLCFTECSFGNSLVDVR